MGSTNNRATKEAQRAEEARQAAIKATQSRVNSVFDSPSRAADINDFVGGLREFYTGDLDRQKADTDRQLRFAMARSGQIGGSVNRDTQKRFGEEYGRGVLDVERKALGAGAQLEAADQDARARLIQLATSGLDTTTAAAQSAAAMRSNLQAGRSTAQAEGMGDVFGVFAQYIKDSRESALRRRTIDNANDQLYGGG